MPWQISWKKGYDEVRVDLLNGNFLHNHLAKLRVDVSRKQEQALQRDCHGLVCPNIHTPGVLLACSMFCFIVCCGFNLGRPHSWHLPLAYRRFSSYLWITLEDGLFVLLVLFLTKGTQSTRTEQIKPAHLNQSFPNIFTFLKMIDLK